MTPITAIIALLGSALAYCMRPEKAVLAFSAVLFLYPQQLTLNVGSIKFSTGRIIIIALLCNMILRRSAHKAYRWDLIDLMILVFFITTIGSYLLHAPPLVVLQRELGQFFDKFLPFFAIRMAIQNKEQMITFFRDMLLIAIPLALMGIYQSMTGHNPVGFMRSYYSWGGGVEEHFVRNGLYRATVSFGNYIAFGMYFAALAPLAIAIKGSRFVSNWKILLCFMMMIIGVISSMSSGPLFSLTISMAFLATYPLRRFWPVVLFVFLLFVIFTEVFSNRHFYHVLTRFALHGSDAYYRIGLIDKALGGGMDGHWLTGYGYVGVNNEGYKSETGFDWGEYTDMTNIYVAILARTGLIGLIPYLVINYMYYRRLYQTMRDLHNPWDTWMVWCFSGSLVGWNIAMMTVAPLAQTGTLLYMFIGLCCNMPYILNNHEEVAVGLTHYNNGVHCHYRKSWKEKWSNHHA